MPATPTPAARFAPTAAPAALPDTAAPAAAAAAAGLILHHPLPFFSGTLLRRLGVRPDTSQLVPGDETRRWLLLLLLLAADVALVAGSLC
jgi:hypothetical protein